MHKLKKTIPFVVLRMLGGMIPSPPGLELPLIVIMKIALLRVPKRRMLKVMVLPSQNHD
jgi:hypothetical protein